MLDKNYSIRSPNSDTMDEYRHSLPERIDTYHENSIMCYTDGSSTEEGVGGGYLTTTKNITSEIIKENSFKLPDHCSVFQAEVMAIKEGATSMLDYRDKTITFWSDSLSALQALSNKLIKSSTVRSCHEVLTELATHNDVSLNWIAAHLGFWGNERADGLAKSGTTCDNTLNCYMPHTYIKSLINDKVDKLAEAEWDSLPHWHTKFVLGEKQKTTIY